MSSARSPLSLTPEPLQAMNSAPDDFDAARDLPHGFLEFLLPLHRPFTPRQQRVRNRAHARAYYSSVRRRAEADHQRVSSKQV